MRREKSGTFTHVQSYCKFRKYFWRSAFMKVRRFIFLHHSTWGLMMVSGPVGQQPLMRWKHSTRRQLTSQAWSLLLPLVLWTRSHGLQHPHNLLKSCPPSHSQGATGTKGGIFPSTNQRNPDVGTHTHSSAYSAASKGQWAKLSIGKRKVNSVTFTEPVRCLHSQFDALWPPNVEESVNPRFSVLGAVNRAHQLWTKPSDALGISLIALMVARLIEGKGNAVVGSAAAQQRSGPAAQRPSSPVTEQSSGPAAHLVLGGLSTERKQLKRGQILHFSSVQTQETQSNHKLTWADLSFVQRWLGSFSS